MSVSSVNPSPEFLTAYSEVLRSLDDQQFSAFRANMRKMKDQPAVDAILDLEVKRRKAAGRFEDTDE